MSPIHIYLMFLSDSIKGIGIVALVATMVVLFVLSVIHISEFDEESIENKSKLHRLVWIKRLFAFMVVFLTVGVFVPSQKQIIMMYAIPKVMNSDAFDKACETPEKAIDLLNKKLDEALLGDEEEED